MEGCSRKKARYQARIAALEEPLQDDHDADWISELPDDILVVILSRLPIREAATTSCLARRWSNLWKSVTHLDLDGHTIGVRALEGEEQSGGEARAAEFIRKVDSILAARAGAGAGFLESLSVWSSHLTRADAAGADGSWAALAESATRVERFVLRTARKSTQEAMGGGHVEPYEFQLDSLATVGSRLREVKLQNCGLKKMAAAPTPFSSLAVVRLEFVSATGRQVRSVLDACGSLRSLLMYCCHLITRLRVAHARLRLLQVDRCRKLESMRIRAPELLRLRYVGHRIAVDYAHAPLLCNLQLILLRWRDSPLDCLGAAPRLPRLKTLSMQFPSLLVPNHQLRRDGRFAGLRIMRLFLQSSWSESIVSVAYLLQSAPLVKTLELEGSGDKQSAPSPTELNITWPKGCRADRTCHVPTANVASAENDGRLHTSVVASHQQGEESHRP